MKKLACPYCKREATIDDPEGWVCACEVEQLKGRIATLVQDMQYREAEFLSTMRQRTRLLPAVDEILTVGEQAPALPRDIAAALQKLSDARQAAS